MDDKTASTTTPFGLDNVRAVSPEELRHHSRESIGQSNDRGAAPSETPEVEQMLSNLILVD